MRVNATPGAPNSVTNLVTQLNVILTALSFPKSPVRLPIYADTDALPPASDWKGALVHVADVGSTTPGLAYSDGTDWRRADTNATL